MRTVGTHNEATRKAWLEKVLRSLPAGSRILDAGAGELHFKQFCSHLQYVSQDFGQYDGQGDAKGLQTGKWDQSRLDIVCDIVSIPEPDASFDAILCVEVFEHLPEPVLALKEFSRLLKKGGQLVLTAPFCSLTHFAPYHFYTGFNRYFYQKHLTELGFSIEELSENGNFFEFVAQELRRVADVSKRYANDKPSILERAAVLFVLKMLSRFSRADSGSSELLHFGFSLKATKQ